MRVDRRFQDVLEATIDAVEEKTSAELVVVLAAASGSYRDCDFLAGAGLGLATLGLMVFSPWPVNEILALSNTALAFLLGAVISARIPALRRALSRSDRRREQVLLHARAAFKEEGVGATRERNGLLLYFSLLERQAEILPDTGIEGRIPRARWNEVQAELQRSLLTRGRDEGGGGVVSAIRASGELLAEAFPPHPENPDEIPNRPRIRR